MQSLELRPMTTQDIHAVMLIEMSVYEFPWTKAILADCLRVGYDCWVVTDDERIIGHGVISVAAGESHILNLAISRDRQGQGIGRQLLTHLMNGTRQVRSNDVTRSETK